MRLIEKRSLTLLNNCQEAFVDKLRSEIRQMTDPDQKIEPRDKERLVKLRTLAHWGAFEAEDCASSHSSGVRS